MKYKPLVWLTLIVVALMILGFGAIRIFVSPQRIAAAIIPRMEELLDRRVSVGSSEFSYFPPGIRISNLAIANNDRFAGKPLARIDHINAYVQLLPLLVGRIKIKEVAIDGWEMLLQKDSVGAINYDFFRARNIFPESKEQAQEPLCRRFRLDDGRLLFRDDSTGIRFVLGNIRLSYDLRGERLSDIAGKLEIDSLFLWADAGNLLIHPAAVEADWRGFYSALHDSVAFRRCNWRIDKFSGRLDGSIASIGTRPAINLRLLSERTDLADCADSRIVKALPLLRDMKLAGQARLEVAWSGIAGNPASRNLNGKVSLADFAGTLDSSGLEMRSQLIESNFNEKTLSVYTESATVNGSPATLRLTIDNYEEPTISGEANVSCRADVIARALNFQAPQSVSGEVSANISGFIKSAEPEQSRIFGSLLIERLAIVDTARPVNLNELNLDMQFTGDYAQIARCDLASGDNNLQLSGSIVGFPAVLAGREHAHRPPQLDAVISSAHFDFDALRQFGDSTAPDTGALATLTNQLISINSSTKWLVAEGRIAGIDFTNLESRISVVNRIVYSDSTTCRVFAGKASGEIVIDLNNPSKPDFELEARSEEVLADLVLDRFTGFGPRLTGDADFQITAKWKGTTTDEVLSTLTLRGEAVLDDGRITPFDLSRQFESALSLPAFDRGKVEDLVCSFLYADRTVRLTTLAFDSDDIEYAITGSLSSANNPDLRVTRKISKDEAKSLRSRSDFTRVAGEKNPKTIVIEITGSAAAPKFAITGAR